MDCTSVERMVDTLPVQLQTRTGWAEEQHSWWCSIPGTVAGLGMEFGTGNMSVCGTS